MKDFYQKLKDLIVENNYKYFDNVEDTFKKYLDKLVKEEVIHFKEVKFLGSFALEIKIRHLLSEIGFTLENKLMVDCDTIIKPEKHFRIDKPIVIEIKSGKSLSPSRDNLRQLDDWIFELSGEELARREGLGKDEYKYQPITSPMGRYFVRQNKIYHPTPHKGLMIYNSVEGHHFNGIPLKLEFNELEFCKKRNICVLSFAQLTAFHSHLISGKMSMDSFWATIHRTTGCLELIED